MLGRGRAHEVRREARVRRLQARRHAARARRAGVLAFLEPLPVGRLWGVGEKTADILGRLAIRTIGDLARTPAGRAGSAARRGSRRRTCSELAHGVDDRDVIPYEAPKSVGHEETFERDLDDDERDPARAAGALSGRVAARLRDDGYRARTVTLKVRLANFTTLTRSRTLPDATDVGRRSLSRRRRALPRAAGGGDGASGCWASRRPGLQSAGAEQLALLRGERWGDVERTIDRIERAIRKGAATQPATLLGPRRERRCSRPQPKRCIADRRSPLRERPSYNRLDERSHPERPEEHSMPLNDHEQRILDEIERRLDRRRSRVRRTGRAHRPVHAPGSSHPLGLVAFVVGCSS